MGRRARPVGHHDLDPQAVHRRPGHPQPQVRGRRLGRAAARSSWPATPRTDDGSVREHDGQVWFLEPGANRISLRTIFARNTTPDQDGTNFDGPDNITVSPHGGIVLAEDGEGVQHLIGVGENGMAYPIARNDLNGSEFAGPTFSPDGSTLFAGIQEPGHVLAITGPWQTFGT